ncbi:mannose-6-phosphate isomerase [Hysterangium stoloniferum]|nr:mannose-6-phosphate isomerase [Hysterangium stoloniferum]
MCSESTPTKCPLKCGLQNYDCGKRGSDSLVARLAPEDCGIDFEDNESNLTRKCGWGRTQKGLLPYMIIPTPRLHHCSLSIRSTSSARSPKPFRYKPTPINKLAEKLKITNQKGFVDANYKPEMALALGDFRGFVGFKPIKDILQVWEATPELREACGIEITARDADPIKSIVSSLHLRAQSEIESFSTRGDVGVLVAPFLMNLVTLSKGEAVYVGADDAHAYLSRDIIECMAASDNAVNAAFVPPEDRDPCIFTEMLTYAPRSAETLGIPSTRYKGSTRGRTTAYDPPLVEFTVLHTSLDPHYNEEQLQPAPGPTTGIVLESEVHITTAADKEGIYLKAGGVIFVAAAQKFQLHAVARGPTEIFSSTVIV